MWDLFISTDPTLHTSIDDPYISNIPIYIQTAMPSGIEIHCYCSFSVCRSFDGSQEIIVFGVKKGHQEERKHQMVIIT